MLVAQNVKLFKYIHPTILHCATRFHRNCWVKSDCQSFCTEKVETNVVCQQ